MRHQAHSRDRLDASFHEVCLVPQDSKSFNSKNSQKCDDIFVNFSSQEPKSRTFSKSPDQHKTLHSLEHTVGAVSPREENVQLAISTESEHFKSMVNHPLLTVS